MKHWKFLITIILSVCCIAIGYVLYNYYAPPTERQAYIIPRHNDDTLRIAYIGDSWAAMHQEHRCIIAQMISETIHRPVKVTSFGLHGKTSREIYESLFDNNDMRNWMTQGCDFCFISAGINDTYKKMGTGYYMTSMNCIILFMLANDIRPIILEIPDYDIVKAYDLQRANRMFLRRASMLITGTQMDCKQDFRNALQELINEKSYQGKVDVILFKEWNNNYKNDLRTYYVGDGMHLNREGYKRLDSIITHHIVNFLSF
jgi:lysophospholipase L1-like esterase